MKNFRSLLLLALIACSSYAYGFNWKKCHRAEPLDKSRGGCGTVVVFGLINASISSGQFTTSTGECAAVGMTTEERAQSFYAFNSDKVLEDVAKGRGEYLASIEHLWGCKTDLKSVRSHYRDIVLLDTERQYLEIKKSCHK